MLWQYNIKPKDNFRRRAILSGASVTIVPTLWNDPLLCRAISDQAGGDEMWYGGFVLFWKTHAATHTRTHTHTHSHRFTHVHTTALVISTSSLVAVSVINFAGAYTAVMNVLEQITQHTLSCLHFVRSATVNSVIMKCHQWLTNFFLLFSSKWFFSYWSRAADCFIGLRLTFQRSI